MIRPHSLDHRSFGSTPSDVVREYGLFLLLLFPPFASVFLRREISKADVCFFPHPYHNKIQRCFALCCTVRSPRFAVAYMQTRKMKDSSKFCSCLLCASHQGPAAPYPGPTRIYRGRLHAKRCRTTRAPLSKDFFLNHRLRQVGACFNF